MRQQVLLERLAADMGGEQILKQLMAEHEKDGAAYIQLTLWTHRSVYTFPRPDEVVANGARQSNKQGVSQRMYSA